MRRLVVLAVFSLLAACMPVRHDGAPDDSRPPRLPVVYETKSSQVEVGLSMDAAIKRYPAVYSRLKDEGIAALQAFDRTALADRSEGEMTDLAPFHMAIAWTQAGETQRLASFAGSESSYQGGAHPNAYDMSIFWDRTLRREIEPRVIFRVGTEEQLDTLLCAGLNAEKRRRDPYLRTIPITEDDARYCPASKDVPLVLAPASAGSTAAGVIYLLGPYVGGGYAEGTFRVFLPTRSLRPLLSDTYSDQFSDNSGRLEPTF